MDAALLVLDAISKKKGFNFDLKHELAGGVSIDKHNSPLTDSVTRPVTITTLFCGSTRGQSGMIYRKIKNRKWDFKAKV